MSLHGADPAPAEKKKEAAKAPDFDVPIPLNIPVKGIKIPHRDETGKLLMTIEAEVATKLDDQHIELQNMKIESLDDDGKKINIEVPHSIFNIETRILSGDSRTWIRRDDFEITGDAVEFNTKTRFATMRGNIRMILQSANIEQ
ncbi:MAG: LPS export ABC transporter periplasmic protein LptC [Verrucomicrobiae bacterium]